MKKLALIAGVFGALTFTACENGEKHCWKVTYEYEYKYDDNKLNDKKTQIVYHWNTNDGINVEIEEGKKALKSEGCYNIKFTKKKVDKNESDCHF